MSVQSMEHLKALALKAPPIPRDVPSYSPQARFYEAARRQVPVLVDELERLREELKKPEAKK